MVPACQPCDDSKGSRDYRVWLTSRAHRNPARDNPAAYQEIIRRVEAYQQHFVYTPPADFVSALTPEQLDQYSAFAKSVAAFRSQLASFGLFTGIAVEGEFDENNDSE
jgi:hypothetical protein